jgi:hypothetical protein
MLSDLGMEASASSSRGVNRELICTAAKRPPNPATLGVERLLR